MGSRREFIRNGTALAGASALFGCSSLSRNEGPADTLIVNARIATLNPRQPEAEAIAIRGEKIIAVGSRADLDSLRNEKTRVIDAGRRTIIPGLNDAHTH